MVKIITDSAADFEPWELEQKQIHCIPLTVCFGDQEYQENNANWLPAILEAKEKELAEMQQRLQQFSQNASMEYSNMQQQLLEPVMQKAREAVEKIGKANGFTYVFDLSAGSIIYFDAVNSTDILPMAKSELGIPADKTVPTNMAAQAN